MNTSIKELINNIENENSKKIYNNCFEKFISNRFYNDETEIHELDNTDIIQIINDISQSPNVRDLYMSFIIKVKQFNNPNSNIEKLLLYKHQNGVQRNILKTKNFTNEKIADIPFNFLTD
jgi:hypothetical protein